MSTAVIVACTLRKNTIAASEGLAKTQAGGWSIVMSGGPNDPIGSLMDPPIWVLSGRKMNKRRPTEANLKFLRKFAVQAGAANVPGDEMIIGTWQWRWYEINGKPIPYVTEVPPKENVPCS